MFSALGQTIQNVASSIASFLHFSAPDEGPLAEYETWMPDFMKGLAQGIERGRGLVQAAVGDVAEDLVMTPTVTATGSSAMADAPSSGDNAVVSMLAQVLPYLSQLTNVNADQGRATTSMLSQYLPYIPQIANMSMVTDTGALVGQLAPKMNQQLGQIATRQRRQ